MGRAATPTQRKKIRNRMIDSIISCPICLQPFDKTTPYSNPMFPVWDHCHKCGGFRNWLCTPCNKNIAGFWKRPLEPEIVERIGVHLKQHDCTAPVWTKRDIKNRRRTEGIRITLDRDEANDLRIILEEKVPLADYPIAMKVWNILSNS